MEINNLKKELSRGAEFLENEKSKTRVFTGIPNVIITCILVFFSLLCFFIALYSLFDTKINRAAFVGLIVFCIFLLYPASKRLKKRVNHIPIYDLLLAALSLVIYGYVVFNCQQVISLSTRLTQEMIIIGIIGLILTLEACRRATGLPIVIVSTCFILYALSKKSLRIVISYLFFSNDGVLGIPINACISFIALFVIFGSFLERTGISDFFIDFANSVAGHTVGGPAKVAVISSALCGMVSGSSVGNTVTTGSITIPLMKKNGYKSEFAGAVEAAASTGGQIMPPIMGAAAFLMIEYTNQQYTFIALRACLPALLYFAGIFISVHLEAKKLGLKGIPKSELPSFKQVAKSWYLILPLIVLTYLIITSTMPKAAYYAIIVAVLLSIVHGIFNKKSPIPHVAKSTPKLIIDSLASGAQSVISVGIACAVAGIIAGVITSTGMTNKLTAAISNISNGNMMIAMFLTMITCIILGMGVPTTATYVIMATTCAPILVKMGMNIFAAHMFVFYFGIVADITPPVALAAYAGSAIAETSPMKTAIHATLIAIAGFIVPYIFGLDPALLFIDTSTVQVIMIIITSVAGIFCVSAGIRGYLFRNMIVIERILFILFGLLLIRPGMITDVIGLGGMALLIILQHSIKVKA